MLVYQRITPARCSLQAPRPRIEFAQMKEVASKNDPGDYYGIKFPYTKDFHGILLKHVETLAGWLVKSADSRFGHLNIQQFSLESNFGCYPTTKPGKSMEIP